MAGGRGARRMFGVISLALSLVPTLVPSSAGAAPDERPNIVLVRTDDQTLRSFKATYMPRTHGFFEKRGTVFTNSIVSTPLCCPSRAQSLTGQYAHNNGVASNFPGYPALLDDHNVVPTWLGRAGYRTIHVGKWLHGYPQVHKLEPAPGWDRWLTSNWPSYSDAPFSIDGRYRVAPGYFGDVLARMTTRMIERYAPRKRPFFLQIDEFAPHTSLSGQGTPCENAAIPASRDMGLFADARAPRTPAFNEDDVAHKPDHMHREKLSHERVLEVDRQFGCAMAALRNVDRNFIGMVRTLRELGELGNSLIVFTSDNGHIFGERRVALGKGLPYDENIRVPLAVAGPRGFGEGPGRIRAAAANVDLPPTLLHLARTQPCIGVACRRLDGRSLVPLLKGRRPSWSKNRAIRTSFDVGRGTFFSCAWDGYWTPAQSVVLHTSLPEPGVGCEPADVWEAYNLKADPFQLEASHPTAAQQARFARLHTCTGVRGRDVPVPGRAFCE
jgi:N-acetylglucosamine-6-sulfatase